MLYLSIKKEHGWCRSPFGIGTLRSSVKILLDLSMFVSSIFASGTHEVFQWRLELFNHER